MNIFERISKRSDFTNNFWRKYLERASVSKISWNHSSGFDLRPFYLVNELSEEKHTAIYYKIGMELKKTEFIFSDSLDYYYSKFLQMSTQPLRDEHISGLYSHFDSILVAGLFHSIQPFSVFTNEERQNRSLPNRCFDGFLIKLGFMANYVTIVFFCLDDYIVKELINESSQKIVAIFESTAGGGEGGALALDCLFEREEIRNIRYLFSDNYRYNESENKPELTYSDFLDLFEIKYYLSQHTCGLIPIKGMKDCDSYGGKFCLGINKENTYDV